MKLDCKLGSAAVLSCTLAVGLFVTGCGDSGSDTTGLPAPDSSVPAAAKLDISAFDVSVLEQSENPTVANNAKQLSAAYGKNDYTRSAYALGNMAFMPLNGAEQESVRKAIESLRNAAELAAADGNENAQRAIAFLNETFGNN